MNMNQYSRNLEYRIRSIDNEYYLLGCDRCFKLNHMGVAVFKYIGKNVSIDQLVAGIIENFSEENTEKIKEDIINYINKLIEYGVIQNGQYI